MEYTFPKPAEGFTLNKGSSHETNSHNNNTVNTTLSPPTSISLPPQQQQQPPSFFHEPLHIKTDSVQSVSSVDTLASFRLKRFNSASSLPSSDSSFSSISSAGSIITTPITPTSATAAPSSLKKVARFPLQEQAQLVDETTLRNLLEEDQQDTANEDKLLVIDVRPYMEFNTCHIKNAVNFNLPSTLLKRPGFTLQKCLNNISLVENVKVTKFLQSNNPNKIVLFHDDSAVINSEVPLNLYGSINKFINDASFQGHLYVLKTGFPFFKSTSPEYVESTLTSIQQQCSSPTSVRPPPHNRSLSLANISSAATTPCSSSTPTISPSLSRFQLPKLPKTPVFKIRHNEEFYDFDNYKVLNEFKFLNLTLNKGPSTNLPNWFKDLFYKNSSLSLIEKFKNLEIEEKKRINNMIQTNSVGSGIELGYKNRYKDIFPYEHSRVKLAITPTNESNPEDQSCFFTNYNNYINANFINAPHLSNLQYIATQAPLMDTTKDFAKLCEDNNIDLIIALTDQFENGLEKCYPYWNDTINFQALELTKLNDLILRRLRLTKTGKEILQIQILNWSDYDIMINQQQNDVLKSIYLKKLLMQKLNKSFDNTIVHCSAGCGRTGTFCTLDSIINEDFDHNGNVVQAKTSNPDLKQFDPVFEVVQNFRNQRISMVQNLRQYLFIYDCLLNYYENFQNFHNSCFKDLNDLKILNDFLDAKSKKTYAAN